MTYGKGVLITREYDKMDAFLKKFHPKPGDQIRVGREFVILVDDDYLKKNKLSVMPNGSVGYVGASDKD